MADLLPNNFEATNLIDDDQITNAKRKQQEVTQFMDWIQCFSTYTAVVSRTNPDHIIDLIAYLNLIIKGQRRFQDFDWASYDRQFRQKAAAYIGALRKAHCGICHVSTATPATPNHPLV